MPRLRFTLRRMMVVVAIVGAGLAYSRFAIRVQSSWEPRFASCTKGMSLADEEADVRRRWIEEVLPSLAAPPIVVAIGIAIFWVKRRLAVPIDRLPENYTRSVLFPWLDEELDLPAQK
ncbi:MAG: hypothetical protein JWN86_4472 [Planctomycetota bacterium]|nr:hypothetical protein [Planctomycetota bacterium]